MRIRRRKACRSVHRVERKGSCVKHVCICASSAEWKIQKIRRVGGTEWLEMKSIKVAVFQGPENADQYVFHKKGQFRRPFQVKIWAPLFSVGTILLVS
jgi:hypothetical protein